MNQISSSPTGAWKIIALFTTISLLAVGGYTYQKLAKQIAGIIHSVQTDRELDTLPPERVQVNRIIAELCSENIILDKKNLSIRITNQALLINGVRQPPILHQEILRKYVKKPEKRLNYTYTTSVE